MVSEGVDIPRLRVGVYATAAKTPLIFRQIVGRFVRTPPRQPVAPRGLCVPAGPYATAATPPLIFRQIAGRFVRPLPSQPVAPSWLYVPADPVLRDHAATIETELRGFLRRPADEDPVALDEREERRQTERSDTPEFVPLSADVAPQMTLFGAPAPAPSPAASRWASAMAEPDADPEPEAPREIPAF